ncbi:hypothetical protein F5J12DRAFT_696074, partial [Pisolithus orientalis]|uniref:uncharacterized protein n=1 Tax=Pisolithus orientalis TaxID=936130 RepID=UPI002224C4E4
HPSLANLDHVQWLINAHHLKKYPHGTSIDGALHLFQQPSDDPPYLRCVEVHPLPGSEVFHLIICMSPFMASQLMHVRHLLIDTSFKCVHGWQEFKIEAWDNEQMWSIAVTHAFTMLQSAEAHFILFQHIFSIASADTGMLVAFHHIDGYGFHSFVADGHKGQALGLGMYCVSLCYNDHHQDRYEPHCWLSDLNPYDHLTQSYWFCVTHVKYHIFLLRTYITSEVYAAMLSLLSSEEQPDLDRTLAIIRTGGKKANAWLKNKLESNRFGLKEIYRPVSLIPEEIWKASPMTTNGNEQAHRNVNCDGTNLTLLGGI